MQKLSVSLEDYIEEIYNQVLKNGNAKVTAIADTLKVKKASVTGALNILQEKKLINYAPYSPVTLTKEGEKIARDILKKHENLARVDPRSGKGVCYFRFRPPVAGPSSTLPSSENREP